ncbi:MAG: putative transcriptional regulator, AsnC family [Osedax symbiont Rs2]|nr:MAG: putative transcriptional regulator, AsnC family [Osedax symbiont Rs2]
MDKFDQQIISLLTDNARQSNAEIARKIGLSRTAISSRIQKLEEKGIICGYRVEVQQPSIGVGAYFHINFSHGSCEELVPLISAISPVRECHSAIGDIDMIIYAQAESMEQMEEVRCRLESLPRLTSITTKAVYKKLISR